MEAIGSRFLAVMFAGAHDKRVKFVKELMIAGEGRFEGGAQLFVGGLGVGETVAFEDAAGVGVNHEDGMLSGVEKDRIGSFGTDAANSEKLFPEALGWSGEEAIERAMVVVEKKGDESLESFGLLAEIAGRAEAGSKARWADCADGNWRQ